MPTVDTMHVHEENPIHRSSEANYSKYVLTSSLISLAQIGAFLGPTVEIEPMFRPSLRSKNGIGVPDIRPRQKWAT